MHACIDLGSNSFHLLIGEWDNGRIRIVERLSEKVQLGENVRGTGRISDAAYERGLNCLRSFKDLMRQYPLQQYWALGTNTFRVTENAAAFIADAAEIGINVSPVTGVQEAVLIYAGVISDLPVSDKHRLIIDIGGGSTELIIGSHHQRLLTESLSIGSVAWRDRFFSQIGNSTQEFSVAMNLAQAQAREVFDGFSPGVARAGWQEAHASSGTVKMFKAICEEHGGNAGEITLAQLQQLQPVLAMAIANSENLPGLKETRRDLLLPGWAVLSGLMQVYGIETLRFSATALREGMLDFMVKNEKTLNVMAESNLPDVSVAEN